ncbi:DUF2779 domain-containing protein, partial [Helicobacter felis]|uniref:DUF2779 domain-containing protein n=1 Tax=Helicobacter felis TaxID=214 RepID=UPI001F2A0EAC
QIVKDLVLDLMTPFQRGHYYDPKMGGSYSIKSVLPALVPDFEKEKLLRMGAPQLEATKLANSRSRGFFCSLARASK